MKEYRVRIPDEQAAYLEGTLGDDYVSDAELFRGLVRDHRQYRELLDLGIEFDYEAVDGDPSGE